MKNSLWERLGNDDETIKKAAYAELEQAAAEYGLTPKALYTKMSDMVIKRETEIKEQVAKGERHSAVDFSDRFMPILKAAQDPDADADADGADDSKLKLKGAGRGVDKSMVRAGVSFKSTVFADSREFPIEDQPSARQPRGADDGSDSLGRSYGSEVAARIAGAFSGVKQNEDSQIPVAGSGPTMEMDSRSVPNSGARFMGSGEGDMGRVGGEDRGAGRVPPGAKDGAYSLEMEGATPGSGIVRVGPNYILPGQGGDDVSAPLFVAPTPATSVAKSEFEGAKRNLKRGTFRSAIKGPEAGPSDGQETI